MSTFCEYKSPLGIKNIIQLLHFCVLHKKQLVPLNRVDIYAALICEFLLISVSRFSDSHPKSRTFLCTFHCSQTKSILDKCRTVSSSAHLGRL